MELEYLLMVTLGAFRIGGMLISMPIIGPSQMPKSLKFLLSISISMIITPFITLPPSDYLARNDTAFFMITRELALGLTIGFGARFIFLLISTALEFAGLQMGFAIANQFDPQNNSQISVLAQIGVVLTVLLFFVSDMHHHMFETLIYSYKIYPIGLPDWDFSVIVKNIFSFLTTTFYLSLRMIAPILAAVLTMHFIMGVISRTAPQMNLFFNVAFTINICVGLGIVVISMPQIFPQVIKFAQTIHNRGYGLW